MNNQLDKLYSLDKDEFNKVYSYLTVLSKGYRQNCQDNGIEYNVMIKQKINYEYLEKAISSSKIYGGLDKECRMLEE